MFVFFLSSPLSKFFVSNLSKEKFFKYQIYFIYNLEIFEIMMIN